MEKWNESTDDDWFGFIDVNERMGTNGGAGFSGHWECRS
jgi:hypothetical protein